MREEGIIRHSGPGSGSQQWLAEKYTPPPAETQQAENDVGYE
jgi:hypothetical protein